MATPTQSDLDYLAAHPEVAPKFKARFGSLPGEQAPTAPAGPKPTPTQRDLDYLAAHPEARQKFEARFGSAPQQPAPSDDGTSYLSQFASGVGQGLVDMGKLAHFALNPGSMTDVIRERAQKQVDDLGILEKKSADPGKAFAYSAGQGVGSSIPTAGLGGGVATNLTLGATSGLGAETARQVAPGNAYAEIAGAIAAPTATSLAMSAPKVLLQGGQGARIAQNVKDFARAGTTPTAGQAGGGIVFPTAEAGLSRVPGGAGRMAKVYERQQAQVGQRLASIADNLSPNANAESAGRATQSGITQFMGRARQKAEALFNKVDQFIPGQSAVPISNSLQVAKSLSTPVSGAPAVGGALVNPKIAAIAKALEADAGQSGALPYQALKELRSAVGREAFSTDMLIDAAPRAQMKQLYAALTDDMKAAATAAGPQAEKALARANQYYSALNQRVDDFLNGLSNKAEPAKVFAALQSNSREGGQMVTAVMQSLNAQERKTVVAAVLNRLGKAVSSQQDDVGEVFSTETFLTNWNKLTPRAKAALFSGQKGLSDDLDAIAAASSRIRESRQVLRNPSESAATGVRLGAGVTAATGAVTGQWWIPIAIGSVAAGANGGARLMSSPAFVRWLASSARSPKADFLSAVGRLPAVVEADPSIREDVAEYVKSLREATGQRSTQGQSQPASAPPP